jgi:hypothetical protein
LAPGLIEGRALSASSDEVLVEYCAYPLKSAYPLAGHLEVVPLPLMRPGKLPKALARKIVRDGGFHVVIRGKINERQLWRDLTVSLENNEPFCWDSSSGNVHVFHCRLRDSDRFRAGDE